jgi:hypothetical protein
MLNNIKSEIHNAEATTRMEKPAVRNLGLIDHAAANAPQTSQTNSMERRLRRERRSHRNTVSSFGAWRSSIG